MLCVGARGLGYTARDLIPVLPVTEEHDLGQGSPPLQPSVSPCVGELLRNIGMKRVSRYEGLKTVPGA